MEQEVDPEIIKTTQNSLGKYVKRPPLSEKLLKKPPFRFLHDIVTTVLKTTSFFDGLFDEVELVSENVKDRESKINFLNKVITVLALTTGKTVTAKPSKIIAGQEPDKTNEFLQCLAFALDNKLSSRDAVKTIREGSKSNKIVTDKPEKKTKDSTKSVKKAAEEKKLTSRSSEKLTVQKKDSNEKLQSKNEKNIISSKIKTTKDGKKENTTKERVSTQPAKSKAEAKKTVDKSSKANNVVNENKKNGTNKVKEKSEKLLENIVKDAEPEKPNEVNDEETEEVNDNTDKIEVPLNSSYVISDNDLNSTLSSQDLMDAEIDKTDDKPEQIDVRNETQMDHVEDQPQDLVRSLEVSKTPCYSEHVKEEKELVNQRISKTRSLDSPSIKDTESVSGVVRSAVVRPSSSRPGAPRPRDKHETALAGKELLIVGKVNIIHENTSIDDEEDDTSIVVVESQENEDPGENLELSINQHGHLVQQILDSTKEFSQTTGKTEIEWQFDVLKAKEATSQEIELVRVNIQGLSRVANPLGKLLDHIQEDVEVMRQELDQWTRTYEETSRELMKQKTANEESLIPLHTKIKQLVTDTEEKYEKINDLKVTIHKNATRIEKLLSGGNVQ